MGGKRSRQGKHLLFHLAGAIIALILFAACQHNVVPLPHYNYIYRAERHMVEGNFDAALAENERAKGSLYKTVGDWILLQRGIIYAHPRNPDRDYRQAMANFDALLEEFPKSLLRADTQVWRATVEHMETQENELTHCIDRSRLLQMTIAEQDEAIEGINTRLRYERYRLRKSKKRVKELESQIDELKKIDLGIELKKREGAQ